MEVKRRLIFPLDVSSLKEAQKWVSQLKDAVGVFKIGLELFVAHGPQAIEKVREAGAEDIFLDLKLHDIPATMEQAARAASRHGVDILTVHMLAGRQAVRRTVEAVEGGTKVFGVTVLTSHTRAELMEIGYAPELSRDIKEAVLRLANLAYRAGCHGIVCSGKEVSVVKEAYRHLRTIVPGVRPEWAADPQDQARVVTPYEAILGGADYLVIGRPIRQADNPREAALKVLAEMEKAFEERGF
ncbi:orotidine-5'-phosphate decarboxylase [Thermodesulfatator autotrophicus]|uniref:Orotidine 5'-phosphate decarboxylase n=1 Tax=Thermodesulfatator autotrophicus TaxID=1795632 RepID=A0A177E7D7_9BACT|nr:orotidine-5'-phosphate decarboxylase [Thermodesulfatator autotrophicus]OAG27863.1 orotidine 5-phosphate decarboxylase [Thermodesulfatator autotrophicus]